MTPWNLLIFLFMTLIVTQYLKHRFVAYRDDARLLRDKWKAARERRWYWSYEHQVGFDFYSPEYQTLWDVEIGAYELYLIRLGKNDGNISWLDYCFEKTKFESENH